MPVASTNSDATVAYNESTPHVSTLIFTLNEAENLPRCLDSLEWCNDKFVVDSFSSDETEKICESRKIPFVQHAFEGFGSQRNWALEKLALKYDWVLILDADERVPPALVPELARVACSNPSDTGAFRLRRRFYLWGKWLRFSSLYPNWVVRFIHKDRVRFVNRGHAETQQVDGVIGELSGYLVDENLKNLSAWFERQVRYAQKDAEYELSHEASLASRGSLFSGDPLARRAAVKRLAAGLPFRGFFYFVYGYFFRLGFLDGKDGFVFCRMKAIYQTMIEVYKHDLRKVRASSRK